MKTLTLIGCDMPQITMADVRHYRTVEQEREAIWMATRLGIAPFQPKPVDLLIKEDLDYRQHILVVEFPSIRLSFQFKFDQDEMFRSSEEEYLRLANEVLQQIRYRETLPVPDNVVLGEQ